MGRMCNLGQLLKGIEKDRTVVLTHGVFDLFHIGHLYLLKHSAAMGGKLVVGVDRDEVAGKHKGRRPVFNERYRLELISQLDCVDYVFFLNNLAEDEHYYLKLYSVLKPNVITYGTNFSGSQYHMRKMRRECSRLGIRSQQIVHKYSSLSTTYYHNKIINDFMDGC